VEARSVDPTRSVNTTVSCRNSDGAGADVIVYPYSLDAKHRLAPKGFVALEQSTSALTRVIVPNGPVTTKPSQKRDREEGHRSPRDARNFPRLDPVKVRGSRLATLLVVATATPLLLGILALGAAAQNTGTGTSSTSTTTTTAPPTTTTTTSPPTTTSAPATTTSTTHPRTTTSTHPVSTTTTATRTSSSGSSPWGWVLLAVVIVLAILLVGLLIVRTKRQGQEANWQRSVLPAVAAAELARDLVLSQSPTDDTQHRASVTLQVDQAAQSLERAASSAPDESLAALCTRSAESLRGLAFAIEADHLMRSGGQQPTGDQLASADAAQRGRRAELETALRELRAAVTPSK
jgi:hypothetical protein